MLPPKFEDSMLVGDTHVTLRSMAPEDREIEQAFVRGLSARSRYFRFHSAVKELTPTLLERFTNVNYPNEMALIATIQQGGAEVQIGVARYARFDDAEEAEMAIAVADDWQHKGIATRLLEGLRTCAQEVGIKRFHALILPDNKPMVQLAKRLGYSLTTPINDRLTLHLAKGIDPGAESPASPDVAND